MVNSKKMSKSSIAVIVLSILLVLSMILGLTGAWYTDSDSNSGDSGSITFGTVDVSAGTSSTVTYAGAETIGTVVDGDKWTVGASSVTNASDVQVFYKLVYTLKLEVKNGAEWEAAAEADAARFSNLGVTTTYGYLTANDSTTSLAGAEKEVVFTEAADNNYNASPKEFRIYASLAIDAVQAGNIDSATLVTKLGCTSEQATALLALRNAQTPASGVIA